MRCDRCGWRISRKDYDGDGECFCCFEGQMKPEIKPGRPRKLPVVRMKDGKAYFIDERLRQLRNVQNPNDFIDY